jgi:hypothetical protein
MSATQTLADCLSVKTSRPSCNQDDVGLYRNPIWSAEDKRITAVMPVDTAEVQKAQNQVIFSRTSPTKCDARFPSASNCNRV